MFSSHRLQGPNVGENDFFLNPSGPSLPLLQSHDEGHFVVCYEAHVKLILYLNLAFALDGPLTLIRLTRHYKNYG